MYFCHQQLAIAVNRDPYECNLAGLIIVHNDKHWINAIGLALHLEVRPTMLSQPESTKKKVWHRYFIADGPDQKAHTSKILNHFFNWWLNQPVESTVNSTIRPCKQLVMEIIWEFWKV